MDCLEAQRLVSAQLDRDVVDAAKLEAAKEHCRSCTECAAYVRTLVAVRHAGLPEPPSGLVGRVMDAVAEERAAAAAAKAALAASTVHVTTPADVETPADDRQADEVSLERIVAVVRDRNNRRAVLAWTAAVVLVFLISGFGAVAGLRTIFTTQGAVRSAEYETGATTQFAGPSGAPSTAAPPAVSDSAAAENSRNAAPNYVTVGQTVYHETGEATGVQQTGLKIVGSTSSALGGATVTTRDVLGADDRENVFVVDDNGTLMAFERVVRTFRGTQYSLVSSALTRYGEWPTLPSGLPTPSSPDGSPEYIPVGTDSAGVTVYRQANGDASTGIAVPPTTGPADPAAGNPNWTWWQPTP